MTLPRNPKRQPQGVPSGGQFAPDTKSEASGVSLAGRHSRILVGDATIALKERRQQSWPAMQEKLHEEEEAWAASNAALAAQDLFPGADSLEYNVDSDGTITELEILNGKNLVGSVWLDEAGRYRGSSDWVEGRVLRHLNRRSLDSLTDQGASVEDNPYLTGGIKTVRLPFEGVLGNAYARHTGGTTGSAPSAAAARDALSSRQVDSWNNAIERHERDERAWAASRAAVNARHVFPDADLDELDCYVDSSGKITGVEVLSRGIPFTSLHLEEDGTVNASRENGKLHGSVLGPVVSAGVEQLVEQGATVREVPGGDEADAGRGQIVNIRFDDVIMEAASRVPDRE
ncbi:hypothetical protein [Arthrobacter caoxuetaonis]|uniref:Uncharacterized protein n=1 Tax=Arthrobacter caoxuetaonis TaxID=2886935 RepID=A0A9X1SGF5_9MICC|nr:hypothetical protein [Arthrobacter caoxuetaonis]MCC3299324.1 hypothetical protein [Arthrobacter caoxuetaonis]USQ59183.1 hypothetical protein NF551_18930 [Arthrobacter caoxuetaonis]